MNRSVSVALTALTVLLLAAPLGLAQIPGSNPVTKCTKECYPKDADVNGPDLKRGGDAVKNILYAHFEDILNRAPLNTQIPDANKEKDLNRGYLMPVLNTNTGTDADFNFENNNFIMYSSAGLVEIFDGVWRSHQEPGLAEDVQIKSDQIHLYWYMSANPVPNGNSQQFPGSQANLDVVPQVAVLARMETGRQPYSSKSTVIAEGDTGKDDPLFLGGAGRVNMVSIPGQDPVFEFMVPMDVKDHRIPSVASAQGFVVTVHPYQVRTKGAGDHEVMQADWRVRTGYTFPPRLVFDVANAMETKTSSLSLFDNNMFIRWSFVSPWGSYDTDDKTLKVELEGPSKADPKLISLVILKRSVDHDGHFKPINATWKFDYRKAGLGDGDYRFKMSILNLQNTYILEHELPFKVHKGVPQVPTIGGPVGDGGGGQAQAGGGDDSKGLPGFEPVALVAALALAGLVLRRRKA